MNLRELRWGRQRCYLHLRVLSYFSGMKDKQQISAGNAWHEKDEREQGSIMPMGMTPKAETHGGMRFRADQSGVVSRWVFCVEP